jgi:hypothetical protein
MTSSGWRQLQRRIVRVSPLVAAVQRFAIERGKWRHHDAVGGGDIADQNFTFL